MARTIRGSKGAGYDYGSARKGNRGWCTPPSKRSRSSSDNPKTYANRTERRIARQQMKSEALDGR